jgi:hypothetical protein
MPVIDQAPVSVGIRYSRELLAHHCKGGKGYIAFDWTYELGAPSTEMLDPLLRAMFRDPKRIASNATRAKTDVVDIHLRAFNGCDASWPIIGTTRVNVVYQAILRDSGGAELTRWAGRGSAGPADEVQDLMKSTGEIGYLNALVGLAMRRAATGFVVGFEGDPVVRSRYYGR